MNRVDSEEPRKSVSFGCRRWLLCGILYCLLTSSISYFCIPCGFFELVGSIGTLHGGRRGAMDPERVGKILDTVTAPIQLPVLGILWAVHSIASPKEGDRLRPEDVTTKSSLLSLSSQMW